MTELGQDLFGRAGVRACAEWRRATNRDQIRPPALGAKFVRDALDDRVQIVHRNRSDETTLSAKDDVQELIRLGPNRWTAIEREDAANSRLRRGCSRRSSVVALQPASGHENIAASLEGLGDEELQLARLVSAGSEPGLIVALDPEAARRKRERRAEAIGPLQGCRQVGEHQIC